MLTEMQKEQWLKALRSGRFDQGVDYLASVMGDSTQYCCLGVLAEVNDMFTGRFGGTKSVGNKYSTLPESVLDLETQLKLAEMNDGGMPFDEIADWIEENV